MMVAGLYDTVALDGNGYDQDDISIGAGLSSIHLYNIYHYIKMLSRNVPNTGIYEKSEDERKFLPLIFMLP